MVIAVKEKVALGLRDSSPYWRSWPATYCTINQNAMGAFDSMLNKTGYREYAYVCFDKFTFRLTKKVEFPVESLQSPPRFLSATLHW